MERVVVFIDGSNFYKGMEACIERIDPSFSMKDFTFDYKKLLSLLKQPDQRIIETVYYNVEVMRSLDVGKWHSQKRFFEDLQKSVPNLSVRKGRQVKRSIQKKCIQCRYPIPIKTIICEKCQTQQPDYVLVEKGVDVQIATDLLSKAFNNQYDVAFLITEDGDFVPAVKEVRGPLEKKVINIHFKREEGPSYLQKNCDEFIDLTYDTFLKPCLTKKPPKPKNLFNNHFPCK